MSEFFKWWYTDSNGNEYMSLMHCALNDYWVIGLILLGCLCIVYQYGAIARKHFLNASKYPKSKLSEYFVRLTKVFAFCLITGYGYRALSVYVNPYKLLVLLLVILNYYTYRFRVSYKGLDVFHRINELETKFGQVKDEIEKITDSITINLFTGTKKIQFIPYSVLEPILFNTPFDSDGHGMIINTRLDIGLPCFVAESVLKPNSYVEPHQHDTDKVLTCVKGSFYDSRTDKWYKEGETLLIPKRIKSDLSRNWHDIKTGSEETHLKTLIFPVI